MGETATSPSVIHVTCPKIRIGQSRTMKVESAVFCMYSKFLFLVHVQRICIHLRTQLQICKWNVFFLHDQV